ncbi:MAG: SusC/RagA family TonB-linked outer membrane protein [Bacteroidaceae bacterium]|nr:SusC/RagA family TonB-linked outer membrane protein [Bacteroidaceae bacterium]
MKIKNIFLYTLAGLFGAPVMVGAQVTLSDKESQKVDLGYGFEQSEFITTAAATTITAEELRRTSAISLADALYGKLLGLNAYQNTGFKGEEGRGATFNIRGIQSTSKNNTQIYNNGQWEDIPGEAGILILVDGVERPIDRLTVEEVESVTVLKDAAAVALYGHEAVNGVLLVKTKHGTKDGKYHFKVGLSHKFQFDPKTADMVSAYDYANALNRARANDGFSPAYTDAELQKFVDGSDPLVYPNVDWKKEAFKNTAHESNAYLSFYGGTDKVQYYTQLDYTDARGLYKNPDQGDWNSQLKYSKANIRANVDFEVSPTTRVKTNILGILMETNGVPNMSSNDAWWHLYKVPALAFPIQTAGGVWGGSQTYGNFNLLAKSEGTGFMKTHQRQIWANATLEQDLDIITKGLKFYVGASYDNSSNTIETRSKGYQYGWNWYDAAGTMQETVMGTVEDKLVFRDWVDSQWRIATFNAGLKYAWQFQNGDNFAANANYNMKSEIRDNRSNTWYRTNWQLALHYDHANRFATDLVLAANGSNRSYPAKWAFSPTLGLGYVFINNPESSFLNYGKVRLSGGMQHSDYVPQAGLWLAAWNNSHGEFWYGNNFQSSWGAFLTQFPTDDFMQEVAYKANFGTDLRIANSLDLTFDLFYQQRCNILVSANSLNSAVVGIQSSYGDQGRVASYGLELGLRYAKTFQNGLNLNAGASFSTVKSKILEWIETPAYPNLSVIDGPADAERGLIAEGFFQSQEEIDNSPQQQFGQVKVGDIKYKDVNGDGVINENDYVTQDYGNAFPALNYAFTLGAEYKGFGINATLQGAAHQVKNLRYVDGVWGALSDNRNLSQEYYDHCYDVAGANALYPRLSTENVANNAQNSTIWYRNVSWLKLRDCEVYYKLPAKWLEPLKISGARLFVQGQNLLSFDNIDAMDAENLNTGYPVMKSVNVGLSVQF